jgi:DNA-binding NarL/FixJ family response regulator
MNAEIRRDRSLGFVRQVRPVVGAALKPYFTIRELDLMRELVRGEGGARNKEIAVRLGITEPTIKLHFHKLQKQLHLKSRTALALYVERRGMFRECAGELPSPGQPTRETASS